MMFVVFGDEETEIDYGHRLLQPRMERPPRELRRTQARYPFCDRTTNAAELGEDVRDWTVIVPRFVRSAVFQIGGMQLRHALVIIIKPLFPKRFEIEEVSGVFLDRPFVILATRQRFARQSLDSSGEPVRRAPQPLEQCGCCVWREAELKCAVEPA